MLTLLHTNDFHNHLTAETAERLRAMKASEPNALLLDAGDIIKTGNIGVPLGPEPIWDLIGRAGYDAVTMGNREFHVTEFGIRAKLRNAPCPVLCANMRDKKEEPLPVEPFTRLEVGGLKVIVLGLTVPMVTERMRTQGLSRYLFDSPLETARRLAPGLRDECDYLIALTHIGYRQDLRLAEAAPQIDLILGGHSHTVLQVPERAARHTHLAQAGSHGRYVGVVRVAADRTVTGELLPLKAT